MRKVIIFMELVKEVYFIVVIHLPKREIFCKSFEDNQFLLMSWILTNS